MIDHIYVVEVSTDPFVTKPPMPTRYKFPSERRAMRFASMSMGQGHFVTIHIEALEPYQEG